MTVPVLYIFAGLPGSGKSTLAKELAARVSAAYLRIDTIEQALRDLCRIDVREQGYGLAYRIAADTLRTGNSVVADSCNPVSATREQWRLVAEQLRAAHVDVEVVCADPEEHRSRVEGRRTEVSGLEPPTWQQVLDRRYDPWTDERIVIDTAGRELQACMDELLEKLQSSLGA